jgi:hypothetical protein
MFFQTLFTHPSAEFESSQRPSQEQPLVGLREYDKVTAGSAPMKNRFTMSRTGDWVTAAIAEFSG